MTEASKDAKRFSKAKVVADLRDIAEDRQKFRGQKFNERDGSSQVEGKGEEANRDYAEWRMLLYVAQWIENGEIGR